MSKAQQPKKKVSWCGIKAFVRIGEQAVSHGWQSKLCLAQLQRIFVWPFHQACTALSSPWTQRLIQATVQYEILTLGDLASHLHGWSTALACLSFVLQLCKSRCKRQSVLGTNGIITGILCFACSVGCLVLLLTGTELKIELAGTAL